MTPQEVRWRTEILNRVSRTNWCIDRTSELRKKGYVGRRLGPKQMTTDTAVRVTRMVVHEKGESILNGQLTMVNSRLTVAVPLEEIPYLDYPELLINEHERTEMPFRYVKDADGKPIMPDVSELPDAECV